MIQKTKLTYLISAAAASLGLALAASAQSADVAAPTVSGPHWGLLGTGYSSVSFRYTDLDNGPPSAMRGVDVTFNQALHDGLDFNLGYSWGRASTATTRLTDQDLNAGVTVYSRLDWGTPYVQALAGWEWRRGFGSSDDSFAYTLGTGVEFQLAKPVVLTPFVNFVRATGFNRSEVDYGVKATYRINRQWGVSVGWKYDSVYHAKDAQDFTLGVNYHY